MCFTLVGFGPGLLIQFGLTCAKLYPFFPTTQGCCTRGNPCLFAEINLFPCKIKVQYVFVWATPRCVFGIWNGNAEKTCPEIVIIFWLVGLPGDISIGFIVEIWWECKIWQKIISLTISVLPSHRQFFLGHGTDNYHVFAPDGNWKLRLPKRGLEKQNPSCTAHSSLAYNLPEPSGAPLGLYACGFTSMSATFVKKIELLPVQSWAILEHCVKISSTNANQPFSFCHNHLGQK